MLSFYPLNTLKFDVTERVIVTHTKETDYLQGIAQEINGTVEKGTAAIGFFEDDYKLEKFVDSAHWRKFRHPSILSGKAKEDNRKLFINKAASSKQVTAATAAFGRGTDFFCKDSALEEKGGFTLFKHSFPLKNRKKLKSKEEPQDKAITDLTV